MSMWTRQFGPLSKVQGESETIQIKVWHFLGMASESSESSNFWTDTSVFTVFVRDPAEE